jgi:hypothetical protein
VSGRESSSPADDVRDDDEQGDASSCLNDAADDAERVADAGY